MSKKTVKNIGIILGCSITAKILSYLLEAVLAAFLGATDKADAFYMTTSIFGILYPILDLGIWKVFLPTYKKKLVEKNESKAEFIANTAVTLFLTLSVALVLFLIVFAKPLVAVIATGYSPEKKVMTVEYLRISAPTYLLMATASIVGAMLQSREKFFGSQIREIGTHASKIIYILIFYRYWGIYAAVTAMIVGSVFRLVVQLPFINWKWKFKPEFHFRDKEILPMIKGLPSVAVTAAIAHINGMIDKIVASNAADGAVSCLNYGNKLVHVFSGMISTAISIAVYPTIIQHIAKKKEEPLRQLLRNVICALMFFIVPISLFCFLFSTELVTAAFQRGAFDAAATALTAEVFVCYCVGMLFLGVATIVTNVFYGFGDTKITMYISLVEIGLNIVFDLIFYQAWGVAGLAFATSVSAMICLCIRFIYLKKYIRIGLRSILKDGSKILFAAGVSCGVSYLIAVKLLHTNVFVTLIIGAVICGVIYLTLSIVCKIKTLAFVRGLIRKKLKRGEGNDRSNNADPG